LTNKNAVLLILICWQ